ncbi:MAG TPA: hypothetical protein VFK56_09495 [Mycobacterium sp.]|nr:hypothetical protein [Mycobacterium sp.]
MKPEEKPAPDSRCIVESCARPASTFVDIADGDTLEGESSVIMCDVHAAHWRSGGG